MSPIDLRSALNTLSLPQSDFARLVGVTPRAVSLWLSGERAIPGPLAAYLRLLIPLPISQREAELSYLGLGAPTLRAGMYKFGYSVASDKRGEAMLVLDGGRIFGTDAGKSRYDGSYVPDYESALVEVRVRIELRAGETSVVGPAQPFDWILEAWGYLPPHTSQGKAVFHTNLGTDVEVVYDFMRALPNI